MSDIPEIPKIPTETVNQRNETLEKSNGKTSEQERGGPSDQEVKELEEEINSKIESEVIDLNNDTGTDYLKNIMEDPIASEPVGIEELEEISRINEQILKEEREAKERIREIPDAKTTEVTTELKDDIEPESNENVGDEEVVEEEWKWLDENLDPETKEFLESVGEENLAKELTLEELLTYEKLRQLILDRIPMVDSTSSMGTLNSKLDALPDAEEDNSKELIKILLRAGVRISTRVIAFISDEIVKSADKDDKATRFIFGSIRDAAKGAESMLDTAVTGEDRPTRLTKEIRNFMLKKKPKESVKNNAGEDRNTADITHEENPSEIETPTSDSESEEPIEEPEETPESITDEPEENDTEEDITEGEFTEVDEEKKDETTEREPEEKPVDEE